MPTKNLIVFRTDSRGAKGLNSVERCIHLADAHRKRSGSIHFAISENNSDLCAMLESKQMKYSIVSSKIGSMEDCEEVLALTSELRASALVIDGAVFQRKYLKTSAKSLFTAVLDDEGERPLPVQLIINSSFSADERFYTCRADSTLLLGPEFQILSPEITQWTKPIASRAAGTIPRYFISCIDERSTARILDSLPRPMATTVLAVGGSADCQILSAAVRMACIRGYTVEHMAVNSVSDSILFSDAAIVCPDSPIGLLAYCGISTLVVASENSRWREVQRIAEEKATLNNTPLDQASDSELSSTIAEFMGEISRGARFGERLSALVDGHGTVRILDCIEESIRPRLRLMDAA